MPFCNTYRYLLLILFTLNSFSLIANHTQTELDSADHYFGFEQLDKAKNIYSAIAEEQSNGADIKMRANTGLLRIALYSLKIQAADSLLLIGNELIDNNTDISSLEILKFRQREAELLRGKSLFSEALTLHLLVLSKARKEEDASVLAYSYLYASTTHEKLANYQSAIAYGDSAVQIFETFLDSLDKRWGSVYNIMGSNYLRINDYVAAEENYQMAIDVLKSSVGSSSTMLAMVYTNLSNIYSNRGEFQKAIDIAKKSMYINQKMNEEDGLGFNYYALGVYYYYLGDWGRCKDYMEACIDVRLKVYGESHYRLASPYEVLGIAYECFENYDMNLRYLKKAMSIKKKTFGADHIEIGFSYENIAIGYLKQHEIDSATHYIMLSNAILKNKLASNDLDMATHLHTLSTIYLENNEPDAALNAIQKSSTIHKLHQIDKTPDFAINKSLEGSIYLKLKDYELAKTRYHQAIDILRVDSNYEQNFRISEATLSVLSDYVQLLYTEYKRTKEASLIDSIGYVL